MSHGTDDDNQADRAGIGSQDHRTRLLTKLNCLIAVIEVAIAKIARSLESPGANEDRLVRIRSNLENTLAICKRAKTTLVRSSTESRPSSAERRSQARESRMGYRDYVELTSIDEYRKFKELPPIKNHEIKEADLDDLLRRLSGS